MTQEEEEEMLRRHQMVLMAPDNDEDEIVDLLGSQIHPHQTANNQSHSQKNQHSGSIHGGSTISKMSIIGGNGN
jgi:hypothetical protein